MLKLLLALLVVALPLMASAAEETIVHSPDPPDSATRSWLTTDIFHALAHACNVPSSTCGPDNLVTNPFGALIRVWVPSTQSYERLYIFTDTEGNVLSVSSVTSTLSSGFNTIFLSGGISLPNSSDVATRGLYKFISILIAADGRAAFSDYYRFRVNP